MRDYPSTMFRKVAIVLFGLISLEFALCRLLSSNFFCNDNKDKGCEIVCYTTEEPPKRPCTDNKIICIDGKRDRFDMCKISTCIEKAFSYEKSLVDKTTHDFLKKLKCCLLKKLYALGNASFQQNLMAEYANLIVKINTLINTSSTDLSTALNNIITTGNAALNSAIDTIVNDANTLLLAGIPDTPDPDNSAIKTLVDTTLKNVITQIDAEFVDYTANEISDVNNAIDANRIQLLAQVGNAIKDFQRLLESTLAGYNTEVEKTIKTTVGKLGKQLLISLEKIVVASGDNVTSCLFNENSCPLPWVKNSYEHDQGFDDCDSDPCE